MEINLDNYSFISLKQIKDYKDIMKKDKIEIVSKNEFGIISVIPYNQIDFLFSEDLDNNSLFKNSEFYIYKPYLEIINLMPHSNELSNKDYFYSIFNNCKDPSDSVRLVHESMLEEILSMNYFKRVENIKDLILKLEIEENRDKFTCQAAGILGEILIKLGLIQRMNIISNILENNELYADVFSTKSYNINYEELMRSVAESVFILLNKPYEVVNIFENTIGFTGCNIIDHSDRVFVNTIEFMIFYNKNINMGMLSKIRAKWRNEYMGYYEKVSKKNRFFKDLSKLDNIFKLGIRQFDYIEIVNIGIAAFLHDITLTEIINYLPVDNNTNNELYSHSIKSYNYLKYSISNNQDVNLAVALHHEYYGYGYGIGITLCEAMRAKRPNFEYQYLITFDSKDILNFTASVYYPVKILEILDIYDLLKYKHDISFTPITTYDEIINYMYDNFLKDEVKIDYVLFSMFKNYLLEIKKME